MDNKEIKVIISDVLNHLENRHYENINVSMFEKLVNLLVDYQVKDKEGYDFISCEQPLYSSIYKDPTFSFIGIKNGINSRTRTVIMTYKLTDKEYEQFKDIIH